MSFFFRGFSLLDIYRRNIFVSSFPHLAVLPFNPLQTLSTSSFILSPRLSLGLLDGLFPCGAFTSFPFSAKSILYAMHVQSILNIFLLMSSKIFFDFDTALSVSYNSVFFILLWLRYTLQTLFIFFSLVVTYVLRLIPGKGRRKNVLVFIFCKPLFSNSFR